MPDSTPHIAIAILNYNGRHFLAQYLPSVLQVNYPNHSVWVIDNASTDDSIPFLQQHYPQVQIVQNTTNGGFAEGYNAGLLHIPADYYLILNSDVELTPGCLQPLAQVMQQDPAVAFVQPRILSHHHRENFEYAGAGGGLIDLLGYPFCRGRVFESVETDVGQYNNVTPVFWASGAAMLARREAFEQLGGFYRYFFMHNEEIDLCWRARNSGWKVMYQGQSAVYHLGGGSLQKENPRKTFFNFRNNLVMITRNMPLSSLAWALPCRLGLDLLAALQMIMKGQAANGAAVLRAWAGFLGWWITPAQNKWPGKRGWGSAPGLYRGSVVWQHFIRRRNEWPFT